MLQGFFQDKRVLVTGACGVKGAWLCWYLLEAGAQVIGVDRDEPDEGVFAATSLGDRIRLYRADVRDGAALAAIATEERVDGAVHLAAIALVGAAREQPQLTYATNVLGTANFLEAVRQTGIERAVVVTTDKVYRSKGGEPWVEDDRLVASGPYAVSKACADLIAQDYFRSYLEVDGKALGIARAGNVLAPGDMNDGRVFVDIAKALARGEPPVILNPAFTRPYTWVGDIAAGYLWLLANVQRPEVNGQAFNFGPQEQRGIPNGELADRICERWGAGVSWQRGRPRDEPFEHQSLDCTRARERLGWQAAYSLDESLAELVAWYKAYFAGGRADGGMRELTIAAIRRHVARARELGMAWAE